MEEQKITYKYSATTGGFYVPGLHREIPADAVEVTEEEHARLMASQGEGFRIKSRADGRPEVVKVEVDDTQKRRHEILTELNTIDAEYNTARTLRAAAIKERWAMKRLKEGEAKAQILRQELASLE